MKVEHTHAFCVVKGNGYNLIKNAILTAKPNWKEVPMEELWKRMNNPNFVINFIWKPINFS